MATTRESIHDAVRWTQKILLIGLRRAAVIGVFVGLFVLLAVVTTRERSSDCGSVSSQQRAVLSTLRDSNAGRSFHTTEPARCRDGEYSAPIEGVADEMTRATEQLTSEGWQLETEYIAFHRQTWRRCFRTDDPGWSRVQITVDATRGGAVHTVRATAPEDTIACELERRETSEIYPPSR